MKARAVLISLALGVGLVVALLAASFGRMGESFVAAAGVLVMAVGLLLVGFSSMTTEDQRRRTIGYALVVGALIVAAYCGFLVLFVHPTPL